jgi:hypothetical protein
LQKQVAKLRDELELLVEFARKMLVDLEAERERVFASDFTEEGDSQDRAASVSSVEV